MIKVFDERPIIDLYKKGYSSIEIVSMLELPITPRQVQRIVKNNGASRSQSESFKIAIARGRMTYNRKPEHLKVKRKTISHKMRYFILNRDNFRCVKCGNTAQDGYRLEIDHIDNIPTHNTSDNLQTLCNLCNMGKAHQ